MTLLDSKIVFVALLLSLEISGSRNDLSRPTSPTAAVAACTDRFGSLAPVQFNLRACAMCYAFLFPGGKPLKPYPPGYLYLGLAATNETVARIYEPNIENDTVTDQICETLNDDECERWRSCCSTAAECCSRHLRMPRRPRDRTYCARTWDGYSCWDDTVSGTTVSASCPNFIDHSITTKMALKMCQDNGTWFKKGGYEWTDFKPCLDKQGYLGVMYAGLSCQIVSVCLLIPASAIFMLYRDLRKQQRVKLHVNFFVSLTASAVVNIIWYMMVHNDLLMNPVSTDTVMYNNPVWCRVLSFFKIYLQATTYFWMFCEGYFLHRLISKAFEPPKNLLVLYSIGWATPALPSVLYAVVMTSIGNKSCWSKSIGGFQWLIYTPNLFCLLVNLIFLCNILRILLFQLHAHPQEPSNFRRGLKAAFMLVPLFGLQLLLTIYRPNPESTYVKEYEYFSTVINSSQGIFVSVIFCYFNGEVLNQFRNTCCRQMMQRRRARHQSTSVTQVTTFEDDRDCARASIRSRTLPQNDHVIRNHVVNEKESMEMEEYNRSNGSIVKGKRGGYMPVPTSVTNESAAI